MAFLVTTIRRILIGTGTEPEPTSGFGIATFGTSSFGG